MGTPLVYYHVMIVQSSLCAHAQHCESDTEAETSWSASDEGVTLPTVPGESNPTHCTQVDKEWSGVWRDWEWDTETQLLKLFTSKHHRFHSWQSAL